MSSKKGDVKFKYVNSIPNRVSAGTFYWKYENNVNQLYFSPTENEADILRLDNIISGQGGGSSASNVYLAGIYDAPTAEEQLILDQSNGTVTSWSDNDWENYIQTVSEEEKYGNVSNKPFFVGNVIICGSREFICRNSTPRFAKITIDGIDYYKSRVTNDACEDLDGNKIEFINQNVPDDVEVTSYDNIVWECFGDNLSQELAERIANFNMELNGSLTINVDESGSEEGVYTLSVIIKDQNPLSVTTGQSGKPVVSISDSNVDDPTGVQTLMSAEQIKDTINSVVNNLNTGGGGNMIWEETIE